MTAAKGGGLRRRRTEHFVQIRSRTIRDGAISYRALGVLAYLLDRPEGWDVRAEQMAADGPAREGREAVRTALRELAAAGYYRLERRRLRDGRVLMGTAISEEPVQSWSQQAQFFAGKPVPVVEQADGTFLVRYPDGTLQPDDFPPPETLDTGDGFLGTGESTPTGDVFPGPGFPASGKPAPGEPAPGEPAPGNTSPLTDRDTDREVRPVPPPEVRPAAGEDVVQPTLTGDIPAPRDPEPTMQQRAFGIARGWIDYRASHKTPVVGGRPLHQLRSLVQPFLEAGYTDNEVKHALNGLAEGIPSKAALERALVRVRNGQPVNGGRGRYTPPPGALDVNSHWANVESGVVAPAGAGW